MSRRAAPDPRGQGPRRLLRPLACAAGRRPDARFRRAVRGRPQRHGQDHALQDHHGAGARDRRLGPHGRRGSAVAATGADRQARRRLRAARPAAVALAHRRRAFAHDRGAAARRLDRRAHLRHLPAAGRAQEQWRRPALRRRAADAGDRARAADQSASPHHGRADRRPCARHRRPGRRHAGAARRGRRHLGARDRAEHRRRDGGLEERRDHGQRPRQSPDRILATCRRPRPATAPARRRTPCRRRARDHAETNGDVAARPASPRPPSLGAAAGLYFQSDATDPLVAADADRAHRGRRANAFDRGLADRRGRATATRRIGSAKLRTADRARGRHARHQGRGAALHPRHRCRQRPAHPPRRRLDQRQALDLRRLRPGNRAQSRARRLRRVRFGSRRLGDRDGRGLRELAAPPGRHRRRDLRRRLGRRFAGRARACARCRSACPSSSSRRSPRAMSRPMSGPPTSP